MEIYFMENCTMHVASIICIALILLLASAIVAYVLRRRHAIGRLMRAAINGTGTGNNSTASGGGGDEQKRRNGSTNNNS